MNLSEALNESVESLQRNRLRSGLTMLGIVWGLATVVLLLSYGKAVGSAVMEGFLGFGDNVIMVWGGPDFTPGRGGAIWAQNSPPGWRHGGDPRFSAVPEGRLPRDR